MITLTREEAQQTLNLLKTFHAKLSEPKREWVGLTDDEVNKWELPESPTVYEFAQFVEAKLKEKNT